MSLLDRYVVRMPGHHYTVELIERPDAPKEKRIAVWLSRADDWAEEVPPQATMQSARYAAARRIASLEHRSPPKTRRRASSRRTNAEAVLEAVAKRPGGKTHEVAKLAGTTPGGAHWTLHRLLVAGLVVRGHAAVGKSWTWTLAQRAEVAS